MRLICPNCDAEYEVDATLIPESGRDVQCSNCGHSWFQPMPDAEAAAEAEEALFDPATPIDLPEREDADEVEEPDPSVADAIREAMTAPPPAAPKAAPAPPPPPPPIPARTIDSSILSVLREEAARESLARRAEADSLETQGDLGLEDYAEPATGAGDIARLREEAEAAAPRGSARRDMLPEVDLINATLRTQHDRRPGDSAAVADALISAGPGGRSGFRRGLVAAIAIFALATALYLLAPRLAASVPSLEGPLARYVQVVNSLREVTAGGMQLLIQRLQGLLGG